MKHPPVKRPVKEAALRLALVLALLALNVAVMVLPACFLPARSAIAAILLLEAAAIAAAIHIQGGACSASYKLAWTLLVAALPVAGLILYALWGGGVQGRRLDLPAVKPPEDRGAQRRQSQANLERLEEVMPNWRRAAALLRRRGFLLYRETDVTYFPGGDAFFADALGRMARAERFIFLEYFVLAEGKLWDRVMEVLAERCRHGVEVKIILDGFGSAARMGRETIEGMRQAGMEVEIFNPARRYASRLRFRCRDHRKILCIDGQYAYTGGVNVADECAGFIRRFGEWKDSGVLLDGPGAWGLTAQFIHMWETLCGHVQNEHDYYHPLESRPGGGWCQPFADGPANNPDNPAEDVFLQCIASARRYIWLTTPYFAVEDSMVRALCLAGDSGVDVRLLLPGIPERKYAQAVAGSYYERLMAHGVRIYQFTPGFLHAKSFVVDGEAAMVGTANMDYRSFQLHCECGVMLYGAAAVAEIRRDMEGIIARSAPVDLEKWQRRPWLKKQVEKVLRAFSIWM